MKKTSSQKLLTILCYHHLDYPKKTPYSLSHEQFLEQLVLLKKHGYKFISLAQVDAFYAGRGDIPTKSAVITFDDGHIDAYKVAYPLLKEKKIPWALFIYPAAINERNNEAVVTWAQVREMARNGVTIGSHSYSHLFLTNPPPAIKNKILYKKWLNHELILSKKEIEKNIGRSVNYFAVPFGAFDRYVYNSIKKAGYHLVFNVHGQNNSTQSDPYNLSRQIILSSDPTAIFVAKITAYPLFFKKTSPTDLARINQPNTDISFILNDNVRYKKNSLSLKVSGFKGIYLFNNENLPVNDEKIMLKRQGYYLVIVSAMDQDDQIYRGVWLFRYDQITPNFLLEPKI